MGLQQLHYLYLEDIKHPAMRLPRENFRALVGEDIELFNGQLGRAVSSIKGQSDVDHLTSAYQHLGVMMNHKSSISEQIYEVRSMKPWISNKKLTYTKDDASYPQAVRWFKKIIKQFKEGKFKHYEIPKNVSLD